ncbi:sodium channel protein Nach isoform X1 [Lucilia cuprina]|uniref:sodium channel protein Nach isoform X1 n=1 Tax=Lucilia cuprina TaxID=7375 RepID=UPI001F060BE2|nr:sodium channel protein Nach isoform X1 [Lucilia cuprina]
MSYNKYKGLLLQNDFEHDEDDFPESHTASTVTLISQQHQQRQFNKRLSMAKPNNQTRITQVKPYEKSIQLQQQQEQQLQPYNIPGIINNIPSHRRHYNNINENNFTAVRRIRKPSLWLGNVEKAKQQQQQVLRNKSRNNDAMTFDNDTLMMNVANNDVAGDLTQHRMLCKGGLVSKVKAFIIEFLQDSSIHGFVYLAKIGLSLIERTLWFAFICVAIFSIISLSRRTWQRFQTSPMVISMDRNKLVWNTSFPSLTVCPHKRIDELKVEEYIMSHPDIFSSPEDEEGFKDFVEKLARLSYDNIEHLPMNKTYGITSDKYLDLLYELKWQFEPEISSGAAVKMFIYETQTEFGICHSVNSLVARYNSYEYWKNNEWDLLDHGERVTVHPLDGEIYAQIINLSTAYDVYFHSSGDIPSITKQRYTFPETDYTTVELIALEISTDEAAKAFSTKQRKCRFKYEAEEMLTAPIYSFGLCLAECRLFLALRVCSCVPHFYRNTLRNGRVLPICGLRGLACIAKLKNEMISLKSNRYKIDCNCLANCDDSNFFVQSYRSRVWFLGANLQWGIIDYPKMQLRRDVIFSFADVLVYIGGLVGFFLGCSALSFMEIIYYFTIRFARRLMA